MCGGKQMQYIHHISRTLVVTAFAKIFYFAEEFLKSVFLHLLTVSTYDLLISVFFLTFDWKVSAKFIFDSVQHMFEVKYVPSWLLLTKF